ncbi:MAG TPA: hypothetical protein VIV60_07405 [Polyangiaceae bacterium]
MKTRIGLILCLGACCFACGERHAGIDQAPDIVARVRLSNELLFVDASRNEIDALDVMKEAPTPTIARFSIPSRPRLAVERKPGRSDGIVNSDGTLDAESSAGASQLQQLGRRAPNEILVLSDGKKDEGGDYTDPPTLSAVDSNHRVRRYELSAPFRQLILSEDARYALLWGQVAPSGEASLLDDPNRVAVVDLDAAPSAENPYERTLKSSGGYVANALITPAMAAGSDTTTPRPMALFSFKDGLSIWDPAHPEHEDITVAVDTSVSAQAFSLKRLVADTKNGKLCMILDGEKVLRVLSFVPTTGASNDFTLSWNQLPLDVNGANDMVLYGESSNRKVLVASGSSLGIVDVNNSTVAHVNLASPGDRLYTYLGAAPSDNDIKQRVVVWGVGQRVVSFVELTNLEKGGAQNIEQVSLGSSPLANMIQLQPQLLLTVLQGGGTGTLDLSSRRPHPVSSSVDLGAPLIESDARRVWVSGGQGDSRIGYFEPMALRIGTLRLDAKVQELFLFEDTSTRRVVVTHDSPIGEVSIVDATTATRASSSVLSGFLVDGWVNR